MALASDPADLLLRDRMAEALQLEPVPVTVTGAATLESPYPVTDFAAASIATAGVALAGLLDALDLGRSTVTVRRELSEGWFAGAVRPVGWSPPPPWDAIAGDYLASDGWIRLHTNAPAHRAAALRVLGVEAVRESVARAVAGWQAEALETAIVDEGGCAAVMRSPAEWAKHPQGAAVAREPLVARKKTDAGGRLLLPLAGHPGASARRAAGARPHSRARRTGGDSACWPASAPTCCASTRPTGRNPRSFPT